MLTALALASSLWVASQEAGARPDAAQAVVVAAVPVEKIADDFGEDLYWLIGSHAADLYSTAWALKRCPGCSEGNLLGPSAEARIALKAAGVASTGLTLWKLRRDGHNNWAKWLRRATVAVNGGLVVNNTIHAIRKR